MRSGFNTTIDRNSFIPNAYCDADGTEGRATQPAYDSKIMES